MSITQYGYAVTRTIVSKDGSVAEATFTFPDVSLGQAKLLADMEKHNVECGLGTHSGTSPYTKADFEAVITGVRAGVGSLNSIKV